MKSYNKVNQQRFDGPKTEAKVMDEVTVTAVEKEEVENVTEIKTAKIANCLKLNLRELPDKDSEVICILTEKATLKVGRELDGWTEVYNKKGSKIEGYVMTEFIQII